MIVGTMRRSYLVIALPVLAATGLICALAFWVGWTMANTEPDLAELEERESVPAAVAGADNSRYRRGAALLWRYREICAARISARITLRRNARRVRRAFLWRVPVGRARPGGRRLESEFAVRGLAAALAGVPLFFFHEVDGRGGDGFVDVAAAEAGAVGAVPVAFYDHGATTAGTRTGKSGGRHAVSLPEPDRAQFLRPRRGSESAWFVASHGPSECLRG